MDTDDPVYGFTAEQCANEKHEAAQANSGLDDPDDTELENFEFVESHDAEGNGSIFKL